MSEPETDKVLAAFEQARYLANVTAWPGADALVTAIDEAEAEYRGLDRVGYIATAAIFTFGIAVGFLLAILL